MSTEYVDHLLRLIVAHPEAAVDPAWTAADAEGITTLRRGPWSAAVRGCYEAAEGGYVHTPDSAKHTLWSALVGGYVVTDQPPLGNSWSRTTISYFDSREYALRLAQRALDLFGPALLEEAERSKDAKLAAYERRDTAMRDEIDRLYQRLQRALEARA